jgi:dynein heavy chain 1
MIGNRFDQRLLAAFVAKLFCQESLNTSYPLIKDDVSLLTIPMPQDSTKHKYVDWLKQLPSNEKPTWLGLPDNAEKVLLISEGNENYKVFLSNVQYYVVF